jgi:hypothetical protein
VREEDGDWVDLWPEDVKIGWEEMKDVEWRTENRE